MSDKWDGKFSNLKISEHGYPELHRELAKLNFKERSDRLRSLATLGLYCLGNPGQNSVPAGPLHPVGASAVVPQLKPQLNEKKTKLFELLKGSINQ